MFKPYRTIKNSCEAEYIVNKSRFIGYLFPVESEKEAEEQLAKIKKKHYDATHNCHAFVLRNGISRCSDDGEPSGTAGVPILEVIKAHHLVNCLCVVTRYFGGILLGAGGLVRAYSKAAALAIEKAEIYEYLPAKRIYFELEYSLYNTLEPFLRESCEPDNIEYVEVVKITANIEEHKAEQFEKALQERSSGKVTVKMLENAYISKRILAKV